jgi:hypothetical protein
MKYNEHSDLQGQHAFLGASQHSWLNYTKEQLEERWKSERAKIEGTELHALAEQLIKKKRKLRGNDTLSNYVNDAIGYGMIPEMVLFYSFNCFGTADAISFRNNELRIHDLKTGTSPAHMDQLLAYAALFFLEYKRDYRPSTMKTELRIYQNQDIIAHHPTSEEIKATMDKIVHDDKVLSNQAMEV